ncbi:helix-turn-helix domain-containing protein (plasmid) [Halobacteriovorax sp. GFR7]|uniref:helix-turn-helix domain-containing protein n=1 Tax=unclassified Halobacteriovorax TaxID=2639665 RepID=UPI003D97C440
MKDYLQFLPYCTNRQKEIIEAVVKHGSAENAAKALGCSKSNIGHTLARVESRAAKKGYAPQLGTSLELPQGYMFTKSTVQINKDGEIERVWNRYAQDSEMLCDVYGEIMDELLEGYKPFEPRPFKPTETDCSIIPWYNIGDAHIGMMGHELEIGENFDIKIAVRELKFALDRVISDTPSRERCVINDLGDATHYENLEGVTQHSGHMLDCDGRFVKMVEAYLDIMLFAIERCLEKHKYVDVIINQGNHSRTNDLWAVRCLKRMFANEPRVNILDNTSVFIGYRMGNTMVLTHHSDKCKPDRLVDVLINDFREDYGATAHHYIWVGHIHHSHSKDEFRGIKVESFNILANKDKYAHDGGWRSGQCISRVDLHREYGEVGRQTLNIQAVRDMILKECEDGAEHIKDLGKRQNITRV